MKQLKKKRFIATDSFLFPMILLLVMWLVHWAQHLFLFPFHTLGVLPKDFSGLLGILFMPLIHSMREIQHIVNNSFPTLILTLTLFYFYRAIAFRVFGILWLLTGIFLWLFAENKGIYHIGMSGVIYGLASFLFASGVLRKYLPLQAISLFVVFIYGSMIWGIFPMQQHVSWEGHLMGFFSGIFLAYYYRREGPQRPKFQYEIEKEMGIEPPDLEGIYNEKLRMLREAEEEQQRMQQGQHIIYHFKADRPTENAPKDDTSNQ
jgi:membrane associated rhomboid family serine protease